MTIGLLFWILFIVGFVFRGWRGYREPGFVGDLFWWVLLFLLGVQVFGFPIK